MGRKLTGIALRRKKNATVQARIRADRDAKGQCRTCGSPAKRVLLSNGPRGERRYKTLRQCKECLRRDADRHLREYPLDVSKAPVAPRRRRPMPNVGGIPVELTDRMVEVRGARRYILSWIE